MVERVRCRTLLLVALASAIGTGCRSSESSSQPAAGSAERAPSIVTTADKLPHPLLWSAEKDGKTTYLLGTIHVGVDAETKLPASVWDKLAAARSFAMETDLSDPAIATLPLRDTGTLHEDLGAEYWQKLQDAVSPGIASRIDRMKPLVAVAQLSLRGLPPTLPMDGVLLDHAKRDGKPIVYLESASREGAILEKWMNARALKEMLDDLTDIERLSKDMLAAYLAGDDAKMLALTERELRSWLKHGHTEVEYEQEMADLIYDRNASWIEAIEKLHGGGGGFVAVGAMHLIGKRSVLEMLAARGFTITRL